MFSKKIDEQQLQDSFYGLYIYRLAAQSKYLTDIKHNVIFLTALNSNILL